MLVQPCLCQTCRRNPNCLFSHAQVHLYVFQWRLPIAAILVYRFVLAAYCIFWLIYTASNGDILIDDVYIPWPAFLTMWAYFLLTLYLTSHFIACLVYVCHRRGSCFSRPSVEHHSGLFHEFHVEPSLWTSENYEMCQGRPESDDDFHTRGSQFSLSILLKSVWILYSLASNMCMTVTLLFWLVIWPRMSAERRFYTLSVDIQLHAVTFIIIIIEHMVSAVPVRLYHYIFTLILGIIYAAFTIIYYAVDGVVIYPKLLDWGEPAVAAITVTGTILIVGPLVHLFFFAIYKLKLFIYSKMRNNCINDNCPSTTSVHHGQLSSRPQRLLSTRQ